MSTKNDPSTATWTAYVCTELAEFGRGWQQYVKERQPATILLLDTNEDQILVLLHSFHHTVPMYAGSRESTNNCICSYAAF